ncbi:MAG: glutathionylspermidine synthase family protein, partial [Verrucomicrobiota bacterium]
MGPAVFHRRHRQPDFPTPGIIAGLQFMVVVETRRWLSFPLVRQWMEITFLLIGKFIFTFFRGFEGRVRRTQRLKRKRILLIMERFAIDPRPDCKKKVESLGFIFHSADALYWDESVCYRFTTAEIDGIQAATNELQRICLEAVQQVIDRKLFSRFRIPEQ